MQQAGFVDAIQGALGAQLLTIVGALAVLLVGWIAALIMAAAVHRVMSLAQVSRRLAPAFGQAVDLETLASRLVFWIVLLAALVAAVGLLDLQTVSAPLAAMVGALLGYLPRLLAALLLALLGWMLALVVRTGLGRLLDRTTLDERLSAEAGMPPISDSIGHVAYWVVLLLFLPLVLGALGLQELLGPVQQLVERLLMFLPDLVKAAAIAVVGYYVAKIVRGIVANLLAATRIQSLARRAGLERATDLPKLAGMIAFFVIFVPALISALDALRLDPVVGPTRYMLGQFVDALPDLLGAGLILAVTWYVARFVAGLVVRLLEGAGLDRLGERLGLQPALGEQGLSRLVGRLLVFLAMLLALAQAANRLQFIELSDLVGSFIVFATDVLLGTAILMIGVWLANLLGAVVARSEHREAPWLGGLVRVLVIGLVLAMGLRAMGIADSIVNLALGLTLGAVAVAVGLSFGLGGREAAGKLMERWFSKLYRD